MTLPVPESSSSGVLLVSFCNVAAHPLPSCLVRFDLGTRAVEWVDVGLGGELLASGVGLCHDDALLYHLSIRNSDFATLLTILDKVSLTVRSVTELTEISDGHSLVRRGLDLVVVSTGTDEILSYRVNGTGVSAPRLVWSPTGARDDTHHLNSVAVVGGRLLCTGFGPKTNDSWTSASQGYVFDIDTGTTVREGLHQPHTICEHQGRIMLCNSRLGSIDDLDGPIGFLSGYSRGLAFAPDGTIYAGTSLARRATPALSGATEFDNPNTPGVLHGRCAVVVMAPNGPRIEIGMSAYGAEIYDLLLV